MVRRPDYYLRETFQGLRRNGLVAFAAVSTAFIALFMVGGALLVSREVNLLIDFSTADVEVSVFLQKDINPIQQEHLGKLLRQMPEVASVRFESPEEAYQRFVKIFHNQEALVSNVGPDALPASFQVKLKNPEQFAVVAQRLKGELGIDNIRDNREILKRLFAVIHVFRVGVLTVALIMLVSSAALIGNTVRMAVFARRKEIGIMRLVGATNWFIRVPFMIEAVVEGLLGAVIAVALLAVLRRSFFNDFHSAVGFWPILTTHDFLYLVPVLLGGGVAVAVLASWLAMRRFLEV